MHAMIVLLMLQKIILFNTLALKHFYHTRVNIKWLSILKINNYNEYYVLRFYSF